MGDVIVVSFTTLDGVVSDPDGRDGTPAGGWMFRFGRGPVDGDKFRLAERMNNGVQLYGRRTWEAFAQLWPARTGGYADVMNAVPKCVATRSQIDVDKWKNSAVISGDLLDRVNEERRDRNVVVIGSLSLVHVLAEADLIDEYRLIAFPTVVGEGERLSINPDFRFVSVEPADAEKHTVLTVLRREKEVSASR
jgi:dihydrofolate reductase